MKVSCTVTPSNTSHPLGLEIWIDQKKHVDLNQISQQIDIQYDVPDISGLHQLEFVLKNKTPTHTQIDTDGKIINDSLLVISDVMIDEFEFDQKLCEDAVYTHDSNGTQEPVQNKFYGAMGCNGTVTMQFSTPIYEWLTQTYKILEP